MLRRGLLLVLFALLPLMLFTHQASAAGHADVHDHAEIEVQAPTGAGAFDPLHSTSCCTMSFGLVAPEMVAAFSAADRARFVFDANEAGGYSNFRSKHFRPPRLG